MKTRQKLDFDLLGMPLGIQKFGWHWHFEILLLPVLTLFMCLIWHFSEMQQWSLKSKFAKICFCQVQYVKEEAFGVVLGSQVLLTSYFEMILFLKPCSASALSLFLRSYRYVL